MKSVLKMENIEGNGIEDYKLTPSELHEVRLQYPMIHLFDQPMIGTEDIRQFIYCPRILFFRYIMHAPMQKTYKMEFGEKKHEKLQKIKNKEDDASTQKYYNMYLTDAKLGLVGLIDYFEFDGQEAFPIEIKSGNPPPEGLDKPHKYQIIAQAILIENNFDFLVKKVRIYYIKQQEIIDYPFLIEDKLTVINIIQKIQKLLTSEVIPDPTGDLGKCKDCECQRYCLRG